MRLVLPALPVVLALALGGCRSQPDPVLTLVESLRAAAEDPDAQAVADRLSDDFKGNGSVDKVEAAATLRRYFAAYESVHLAVYDVAVTRKGEPGAEGAFRAVPPPVCDGGVPGKGEAGGGVAFRAEFTGAARRIGGLDGFLPPSAVE